MPPSWKPFFSEAIQTQLKALDERIAAGCEKTAALRAERRRLYYRGVRRAERERDKAQRKAAKAKRKRNGNGNGNGNGQR